MRSFFILLLLATLSATIRNLLADAASIGSYEGAGGASVNDSGGFSGEKSDEKSDDDDDDETGGVQWNALGSAILDGLKTGLSTATSETGSTLLNVGETALEPVASTIDALLLPITGPIQLALAPIKLVIGPLWIFGKTAYDTVTRIMATYQSLSTKAGNGERQKRALSERLTAILAGGRAETMRLMAQTMWNFACKKALPPLHGMSVSLLQSSVLPESIRMILTSFESLYATMRFFGCQ